uniref:Saposin B-type domain-containing protein n=1 Tax=Alexandrium monilatum TaxID=311494 RepID=A0A7S4S6G9_9DINO
MAAQGLRALAALPPQRRLLAVAVVASACWAPVGGAGGARGPARRGSHDKLTAVHIQCQVCKMAMKEARTQAKDYDIQDAHALSNLVRNLCSPAKPEGQWVAMLDIERNEEGSGLVLHKKDKVGECRAECQAVRHACERAVEGHKEDVVALLSDLAGLARLQNAACERPCKARELPTLSPTWVGEKFKVAESAAASSMSVGHVDHRRLYQREEL